MPAVLVETAESGRVAASSSSPSAAVATGIAAVV